MPMPDHYYMPSPVRRLRVILWTQCGFTLLGAALILFALSQIDDATAQAVIAVTLGISFISAAALGVCAALTHKRYSWVFYLVIVVEGLVILDRLVTLLSGQFNIFLLLGMLIAVLALVNVLNEESRDYLLRRG
ncbi:hypothetical protein LX16_1890 [Stackebrandtia albiflava]|uniref:Uncharacterized protein n=1 Tax=Stackebrandtia albiflava TaxID=406432 RepID=A0A562VE50_9ACTN|nr:hypothetical protein [Stackebrandtia albiflava]TWJ16166.1 hypothetical protein LX16_1890 [Stackebrandtia albiflava]